jgi:hypothetical protein
MFQIYYNYFINIHIYLPSVVGGSDVTNDNLVAMVECIVVEDTTKNE